MALETAIQHWLHAFEQGRVARWVRRVVLALALAGLAVFWLTSRFNGFYVPDAMDQAQIARQIAAGRGFTTLYARPLALRIFAARGPVPDPLPEINQAPLGPVIGAVALRATGMRTGISDTSVVSTGDVILAATGILFLVAALLVGLLLGAALFDTRLAFIGSGLVVCTSLVWRFGISGLPQPAMMLFFNAALLCLLFAMRASAAGRKKGTLIWAWTAAFLLALVTLGNGIGMWIFGGFAVFAAAVLRPRLAVAAGCCIAYFLPLLPWAWHNIKATGQPFGYALFGLMRPAGVDKLAFAADFEARLSPDWRNIAANTATQAMEQIGDIFGMYGYNIAVPAFFLSVLFHTFRGWLPAQFRWAVLLMWFCAFAGMSLAGVEGQVSVDQLHVLFLPVMVFYGFGFLLVMWSRLGFESLLLRTAFIIAVFAAVSFPLAITATSRQPRFNWPPYLPLLVQKLGDWFGPKEAIASDIPWATAWYAERRSLLLPETVDQFQFIDSERLAGAPLVGIYLTPGSGGKRAYADIVNGRYSDWARLVLDVHGPPAPKSWKLRNKVNLPIDGASILLTDKQRWKQ